MADSPVDTEPERRTNPRFDNWPVRRYDDTGNWPVEWTKPDDQSERSENVEWVGTLAPSGGGAYLYSADDEALYEGRIDLANERIVVDDGTVERDVTEESLGERLAEIGDEHDWDWLSSFAREHLDADTRGQEDATAGHHVPAGFEHRETRFQQRNLPESADVDLSFSGSHTFADGTGRVHVLEREFDVDAPDDWDGEREVHVSVDEEYLVAADERAETRAGDAELVDDREYDFEVEVDPDAISRGARIEESLREWHTGHLGTPAEHVGE